MRWAGVVALALISGCGRAGAGGAGAAVRDSAGVRIVEVRGEAAELDRRWGVAAVPAFTVGAGGGDSAVDLFRVAGAHRMADGRLLIANGGTGELLLADPRTGAVRRYGRNGQGPGEFRTMAGLWPGRGDTAWVYDMGLARVTPFTPEGGFGSPVGVPAGNVDGLVTLRGRFADGSYLAVVVRGHDGRTQRTGMRLDSMTVVRVFPGTDSLRTLARVPFGKSWVRGGRGGSTVFTIPFEAGGIVAASAGGYYLGEAGRYEAPVRVTGADIDRERAAWTGDGMDEAAVHRLFAEMPIPRHFPAFARVFGAADGGVWVQDQPGGDPSAASVWTAFGADRQLAARVTLPRGTRPLEVSAGRLVALVTDDDGVERVSVYHLQAERRVP
jgi:hypothetical protein